MLDAGQPPVNHVTMFLTLFTNLRAARVPVSIREFLTLTAALDANLCNGEITGFYHLARTCLVKDERNFDKFDRVFAQTFQGLQALCDVPEPSDIPEEWLRKLAEKYLSEEERAEIAALGFQRLMETLRARLAEQKARHQGGSKWIGTAGTSPFGAHGAHPEGVRIQQEANRHFSAAKVWDRREFKDLDGDQALGQRNMRLALRRLRKFARAGMPEELDLDATISGTAQQGYLDLKLRPERRNRVKILLLLDVGGSMDWHVSQAEALFAAARAEFKHISHFYFHNCPYENVWTHNARRRIDLTPTFDLINKFPEETKLILVGDAAMSPHEISQPGGSLDHVNAETGAVWLTRLARAFPSLAWLNPVADTNWGYTHSTQLVRGLIGGRMFGLTLDGIERAMRSLVR